MKTIIYKNGTIKKNLRDELQTQLPPVSSIDLFNIKEAEKNKDAKPPKKTDFIYRYLLEIKV
ncbi:hypothetical protein [uncultured Ilyobacter sp.]|uniref:hypothetical protein n=1 Tax=uncultured Ilyobacter sp. TaxID=544433 RepID=UPI0029F5144B|nr:hypothetical protein [uncultured Ilyobacter sp.]